MRRCTQSDFWAKYFLAIQFYSGYRLGLEPAKSIDRSETRENVRPAASRTSTITFFQPSTVNFSFCRPELDSPLGFAGSFWGFASNWQKCRPNSSCFARKEYCDCYIIMEKGPGHIPLPLKSNIDTPISKQKPVSWMLS